MSIFKAKGFDTLIGKGCNISGDLKLSGTTVIHGQHLGGSIFPSADQKCTLVVSGIVQVDTLAAHAVTITGTVQVAEIRVEDTLIVEKGGALVATHIYYRTLIVQPDAIIRGELRHLDHSSDPLEI